MPPPWVSINNVIMFDGCGDVFVRQEILGFNDADIRTMLELAMRHKNDPYLNACANGAADVFVSDTDYCGPGRMYITIEAYLRSKQEYEERQRQDAAKRNAKRLHTANRRAEFQRVRSDLYLAIIARGDAHVCFVEGCEVVDDLTLDHIIPLSLGGDDSLPNLRFACRKHNSQRGDRIS